MPQPESGGGETGRRGDGETGRRGAQNYTVQGKIASVHVFLGSIRIPTPLTLRTYITSMLPLSWMIITIV